jgi:peptide/nickel transport system permease protein
VGRSKTKNRLNPDQIHWGVWLIFWYIFALIAFFLPELPFRLERAYESPSLLMPLGADSFGRNLLWLVPKAALLSSGFAFFVTLFIVSFSVLLGGMSVLFSKRFRFLTERVLDFFLAFPSLLIALVLGVLLGPGPKTLSFALIFGLTPTFLRLMMLRASELIAEDYFTAARALGGRNFHLFRRHLLSGLLSLAWIKTPQLFARALLAEATLSFLGLGFSIGQESWGSLLAQGANALIEAPHIAFATGLPLVLTVLSLQQIGNRK